MGAEVGLSALPAFASANGYLAASELTLVQGSDTYLANGTANSWFAMKAAAMTRNGVFMRVSPAYRGAGGYRSYAVQVDMHTNPGLYNIVSTPAPVGTSNHGLGIAADVDLAPAQSWIKAHGAEFGWSFPFSYDSVHFQHDGVTAIGSTNAVSPSPFPASDNEDELTYYTAQSSSSDGLIQAGFIYVNSSDGPLRAMSSLEYSAVSFSRGANAPIAAWPGADIRSLVKIVGLRQQGPAQGLVFSNGTAGVQNDGRLTGTIVY
jgi:hypothetical protein